MRRLPGALESGIPVAKALHRRTVCVDQAGKLAVTPKEVIQNLRETWVLSLLLGRVVFANHGH
jgi:hypothetical protein